MTHDVVIRGGTVVDGTGRRGRARPTSRSTATGSSRSATVEEDGRREIDADGAYVTPGFVDVHTHLDAQIAWDPDATSSCWHGVTSVVLGNCGVAFAPVRDGQAGLARRTDGVRRGHPRAQHPRRPRVQLGDLRRVPRSALDALPKGVNVGGMVGHCALRHYVMGERGLDDVAATDDDIAAITDLVDEAMAAGALGFSTSRTLLHRVPDGRFVPGTWARRRRAARDRRRPRPAAARVCTRSRRASNGPATTYEGTATEIHWMAEINRRTGRPVTFGLAQSNAGPELYKIILDLVDEEAANGGELRPQTTARGIGLLFGLQHRTFFDRIPSWAALADARPRAAPCRARRRRAPRRVDRGRRSADPAVRLERRLRAHDRPRRLLGGSVRLARGARASAANESIPAAFVRISRETDGRALFNFPFLNQRMDAVEELLEHPRMLVGLGDSGAHVGLIMDASLPTWFLAHWVRDREKFTIEEGIRRLTSDTADLFGVGERGRLAPGAYADVNVHRSRRARRFPFPSTSTTSPPTRAATCNGRAAIAARSSTAGCSWRTARRRACTQV